MKHLLSTKVYRPEGARQRLCSQIQCDDCGNITYERRSTRVQKALEAPCIHCKGSSPEVVVTTLTEAHRVHTDRIQKQEEIRLRPEERSHVWWPEDNRKTHHPHYNRWSLMLDRCYNPNAHNYPNYGGRGIEVCTRWIVDFDAYCQDLTDLGPQPKGFSLDRIDEDGNYDPHNVRWAPQSLQSRNRRCVTTLLSPREKERVVEAQRRLSHLKKRYGEDWWEFGWYLGSHPGTRYVTWVRMGKPSRSPRSTHSH